MGNKPSKDKRKLAIRRETIRQLDSLEDDELRAVAGASAACFNLTAHTTRANVGPNGAQYC